MTKSAIVTKLVCSFEQLSIYLMCLCGSICFGVDDYDFYKW
jgi:hypothetical protein